jgi:hypothetical protein
MGIEIPKIEPGNFDDLLREFKSLVPFYTPGWRLDINEKDPGTALVKLFIHFLGTIANRLNRLPEKHFISFLDRIGIKLIPAQPACVPLTFLLSEGAAEHILVPGRTRVAAGEVIFETGKNLLVSPARLIGFYYIGGPNNAVFPYPPHIIAPAPLPPVETTIFPFLPLEEKQRGFYLAFDRILEQGPIGLFFAIAEEPVPPGQIPFIRWEYYNENRQWERLDVLDSTMSLTRTGALELVFPPGFCQVRESTTNAYWIRALYRKKEAADTDKPAIPAVTGVFLNTTPALQCETITAEIAGSGDGTPGQTFCLKKIPVMPGSEDIWIDEFKTIPMEEQNRLCAEGPRRVREEFDSEGNLTGFRVKWEPIDRIFNAPAEARCYEIDNVSGELTFGDGIYGKIPPAGADNITADYRSGGGEQGNVPAYEVKELKTSLPFLDKVFNPLPAGAGSDGETVENLMACGPHLLRHRDRAITAGDFERMILQASIGAARVKCLANTNETGDPQNGCVTVVVIPRTEEEKPRLSHQLEQKVGQYLEAHAAYTLAAPGYLKVRGPVYVEVSVTAAVVAASIHVASLVEKNSFSRLKEFLNPFSGGFEQKGWDFGKIPCFSDFYALLGKIDGIDHVETLSIKLRPEDDPAAEAVLTPNNPTAAADFPMPPYALICNGTHEVEVSV